MHFGKNYFQLLCILSFLICCVHAVRKYSNDDLLKFREEVRDMFSHAYSGYMSYAYPYDELRPLTCDGVDTWGSYSLTLIDALDTLAVMGNQSEFQKVVKLVTAKVNFDADINVSVFETNIRIVGGLLSAHLLSKRMGLELEPGWPCNGPLLRLAEDVARRLLPAFDTPTGMPYGTVNLRHGIPPGETTVTCTAGVGTFIIEFATLSRLTGDPVYEDVALTAIRALFMRRSRIGLFGNHIDVATGRWVALDSGIGAGVDSFFEYLVKGALLLERSQLMAMFKDVKRPIDRYLRKNNWFVWASMHRGQVTLPVFQSLEAFWPGLLSLTGEIEPALKSMHNYNKVWKQYGFTPEFYNILQSEASNSRESYPLRPELVESAMYLYRGTGDPFMLDIGVNILRSLQHSAKTPCGYATIKDARDHTLENRMESFFLSETTKYLYLLFDEDNFIHNDGFRGTVHTLPSGKQCILDSAGYIFNTEAHPIDPAALRCCHDWKIERYDDNLEIMEAKGDSLLSRQKEKIKDSQFSEESHIDPTVSDYFQKPDGQINTKDISIVFENLEQTLDSLLHMVNENKANANIQNNNLPDKDAPVFASTNTSDLPIEQPPNSSMVYKNNENNAYLTEYENEINEDLTKLPTEVLDSSPSLEKLDPQSSIPVENSKINNVADQENYNRLLNFANFLLEIHEVGDSDPIIVDQIYNKVLLGSVIQPDGDTKEGSYEQSDISRNYDELVIKMKSDPQYIQNLIFNQEYSNGLQRDSLPQDIDSIGKNIQIYNFARNLVEIMKQLQSDQPFYASTVSPQEDHDNNKVVSIVETIRFHMVPTFLKNMRELAIQLGADPSYLESSRNNVNNESQSSVAIQESEGKYIDKEGSKSPQNIHQLIQQIESDPQFLQAVTDNKINSIDNAEFEDNEQEEEHEKLYNFLTELLGLIEPKEKFDEDLLEPIDVNLPTGNIKATTAHHLMTCTAQPLHIRLTIAGEFKSEK